MLYAAHYWTGRACNNQRIEKSVSKMLKKSKTAREVLDEKVKAAKEKLLEELEKSKSFEKAFSCLILKAKRKLRSLPMHFFFLCYMPKYFVIFIY